MDTELQHNLRDVEDHVERLISRADSFRDLLQNALTLDGTLTANRQNEASAEQNEQVKKISSWAAIFFAPSFVAGVYGMNFDHMPELHWTLGYPMAIVPYGRHGGADVRHLQEEGLALGTGAGSAGTGAPVPRLRQQAGERQDKDGLDQDHESKPQPLSPAEEDDYPDDHQHGPEAQGIDGEAGGHLRAPHARAEAEALGFAAGVPLDAVRAGRLEPVKLFPGVPVLILLGHISIIPRIRPHGPARGVGASRSTAGEPGLGGADVDFAGLRAVRAEHQKPVGDFLAEETVVADRHHGTREMDQRPFHDLRAGHVQVVGGLVEQQPLDEVLCGPVGPP